MGDKHAEVAERVASDTPGVAVTGVTEEQVSMEETSTDEQAPAAQRTEVPDYQDLYIRAVADLDNFRKHAQRRQIEAVDHAGRDLARNLLPVIDHFRLAIEHSEASDGVQIAFKELMEVLGAAGIEEITVQEGSPFDPNLHHALTTVTDDSIVSETVQQVHRPGYRYKGSVLRAPEVVVAQPSPVGEN